VEAVVRAALAELKRLGRPERAKGAAAYFKAYETLTFFGVDSPTVRRMASRIKKEHAREWTLRDAVAFADAMLARPELEAKGLGQCVLGKFRRQFTPSLLPRTKRWFTKRCTDWASTDGLCGEVLSPLLVAHPALVPELRAWRSSPHLYVRRASAVGLLRLAHNGRNLPDAYAAALTLGGERHHLLQKAAGWLLREAGTTDMGRLERFLVKNGARLSRTTVSYAIERFPQPKRRELLAATREARPTRKPLTADAEIAENRTRSFLRVPRIPR
jgi:3-methyladenine DNA glycosylase AlkD